MNNRESAMRPEKMVWYRDQQGILRGPVDIQTLCQQLADGNLSLDSEIVLSEGQTVRLRDLPEFGGQRHRRFSKDVSAAVKWIGNAWGLLIVSLLISVGPTSLIVLLCSPQPYGANITLVTRSLDSFPERPLTDFDRVHLRHLVETERWQKLLLWSGAILGTISYMGALICATWALAAGGIRMRLVKYLAFLLFVAAGMLLCYGIIHRHESLSLVQPLLTGRV